MKKAAALAGALSLPMLALAQTVESILQRVAGIINVLTVIVVAIALLYFLWGLSQYILKAGEEKDKGRDMMIWGIIALFVMVSVWGLVRVLSNTFNVSSGGTTNIPGVIGGGFGGGTGGSVTVGGSGSSGGFWATFGL